MLTDMLYTDLHIMHATGCLVLAMVLWFCRPGKSERLHRYRVFLRTLACLFFLQTPVDGLMIMASGAAIGTTLWAWVLPVYTVVQMALMFSLFHLVLHTPYSLWLQERALFSVFLAVALVYPLLFSHARVVDGLPLSLAGFEAFSAMPIAIAFGYVLRGLAVVLQLVCMYHVVRVSRVLLQASEQAERRFLAFPFTVAGVLTLVALVALVVPSPSAFQYDAELPLWLIIDTWGAVFAINHRDDFVRMEKKALVVRTEVELTRVRSMVRQEEQRVRREQAVVMRALEEWAARPDKPYRAPGLTLTDVADAVGVPPSVLFRYGIAPHGLSFAEYIAYLREKEEIFPG